MKAAVHGNVLLHAVLALLFLAHPPFGLARLLVMASYAALFYGAYRYNLGRARQGEEGSQAAGRTGTVAIICLLGLLLNLLLAGGSANGMLQDNLAVLCFLLGLFATAPLLREYGSVIGWLLFNLWLFLHPGYCVVLAPLFIVAFLAHRHAVTALALGEAYGVPEHGATPQARRQLYAWLGIALLAYLPLHGWGWWEDRLLQQQRQAQAAPAGRPAPATGMPGRSALVAVGFLLVAYVAWRQLRKREQQGEGKKELQELLSAQGYTRDLDEQPAARYIFPGGCRGQVLKLYDKVLASAEKRCKAPLRRLTPALRIPYFKRLDPARDWETLTAIFNRARYGGGDIGREEVLVVKRIIGG